MGALRASRSSLSREGREVGLGLPGWRRRHGVELEAVFAGFNQGQSLSRVRCARHEAREAAKGAKSVWGCRVALAVGGGT